MGRNREGQPHIHARGIVLDGSIDELVQLGERHDPVELAAYLPFLNPQDGAVQVNVLSTGQLGVKSRAHLQQ